MKKLLALVYILLVSCSSVAQDSKKQKNILFYLDSTCCTFYRWIFPKTNTKKYWVCRWITSTYFWEQRTTRLSSSFRCCFWSRFCRFISCSKTRRLRFYQDKYYKRKPKGRASRHYSFFLWWGSCTREFYNNRP